MAARSTLDPGILNFSCLKKNGNLESSDAFLTETSRTLHVTRYVSMEEAALCCYASFSYSCWEKRRLVLLRSRQKSYGDGWYVGDLSHEEITCEI